MKSVLDRSFQYTPSVETDLRKTFARIRRKLKEQEQAVAAVEAEAKAKVSLIKPASKIIASV